MAPPPLPPDYSGGQSSSAVKSDMMDMGWSMPASNSTQPNTTAPANKDDDWGNAGWGLPGGNTTENNKPPENNNFQQAGGNHHTSGFSNEISSSKTPNSAANTNQVTFLRALCCFVLVAWKLFILVLIYKRSAMCTTCTPSNFILH